MTNIDTSMSEYDIPRSLKPVQEFIDDASNWYVRRSRRRFWKSDNDTDKSEAYKTLHYVLTQLAVVMAPFTPFMAEELYRQLTGRESVHLCDWPVHDKSDDKILRDMALTRELITQGLANRAENGIKVRQPLSSVTLYGLKDLEPDLITIVKEELNVKEVKFDSNASEASTIEELRAQVDTNISEELRTEGITRELIRYVQNARKEANLEVEDRIALLIESDSPEITQAIKDFQDTIKSETLAEQLGEVPADAYSTEVKIDGLEVRISLSKHLV
jgi:isoleucyl-tRNA synthetase